MRVSVANNLLDCISGRQGIANRLLCKVRSDQIALPAQDSRTGIDSIILGIEILIGAIHQRRNFMTQLNHFFIVIQHRISLGRLALGIDLHIVWIDVKPGLAASETSVRTIIPLERGSAVIAAGQAHVIEEQ